MTTNFQRQKNSSNNRHRNETIVICNNITGIAVCELHGGEGRFKKIRDAVNTQRYHVRYVGNYLADLNRLCLTNLNKNNPSS